MTTKKTTKNDATAMEPSSQFAESAKPEQATTENLRRLSYGG
jgi:hypothetical protein